MLELLTAIAFDEAGAMAEPPGTGELLASTLKRNCGASARLIMTA
jgi:hypothetical protein